MHFEPISKNYYIVTAEAPKQLTVFDQQEDSSQKIIKFGENNLYPQEIIEVISRSPIGTACIETLAKYTLGEGLFCQNETEFSKRFLSKFYTDEILEQMAYSWAFFEACGVVYKFDLNGFLVGVKIQDYSTIRLGLPDKNTNEIHSAFLSESWQLAKKGSSSNEFKPKHIDIFSLQTIEKLNAWKNAEGIEGAKQLKKWSGALNIIRKKKPGQLYYTNPMLCAGLDWFYTDGKIQKFHSTNIDNSFNPGFILYVPFDLEGNDENGIPLKDTFKQRVKDSLVGAENAGEPAIVYGPNEESSPKIIPFTGNANDAMFLAISKLIVDHICTVTQTPPVLANIQVSKGLGNSDKDIIVEFDKYLSTVIKPIQLRFLKHINESAKLCEGFDGSVFEISNSRPLAYIPDNQINDYTEEERRASNGYAPKLLTI